MNYGDIFTADKEGLDFLSAPDTITFTDGKAYKITHELVGKPWLIAQMEYGDFRLWWAIAKANLSRTPMLMRDTFRIRGGNSIVDNIITDFYLGRIIYTPSINEINQYLEKVNKVNQL